MAKSVIKFSMGDIVRGSIKEPETAIDYLKNIAEKYKESDIAEGARLSKMFNELKFSGEGNVRDHLLSMIEINQKLRDLDIGVKDEQVVHMGLQSLPIAYSNLRSMYNAQDKKWDLNKLISVCCEEQERIKKETPMILLLEKPKEKKEHKYKPKKTTNFKAIRKTTDKEGSNTFKYKCYFCKKVGHMKKECSGFKAWMAKKDTSLFKKNHHLRKIYKSLGYKDLADQKFYVQSIGSQIKSHINVTPFPFKSSNVFPRSFETLKNEQIPFLRNT
ncbi:hypothetical protein OSB04_025352 [Centaurea solstitialis]|uniref:CCHC-type domain-containing protein n=1 Tax=Centaurea solstitialis TaxID=347529 RepID=A0AA38WB90_9ASTR|nr:hypothetical protein OSB04_025352 [Centaurea solstitialis]